MAKIFLFHLYLFIYLKINNSYSYPYCNMCAYWQKLVDYVWILHVYDNLVCFIKKHCIDWLPGTQHFCFLKLIKLTVDVCWIIPISY